MRANIFEHCSHGEQHATITTKANQINGCNKTARIDNQLGKYTAADKNVPVCIATTKPVCYTKERYTEQKLFSSYHFALCVI